MQQSNLMDANWRGHRADAEIDRFVVWRIIYLSPAAMHGREVANIMNVDLNVISGRLSELHRAGLIVQIGRHEEERITRRGKKKIIVSKNYIATGRDYHDVYSKTRME